MIEIEIILLILAFIITLLAVISDIKTTEVPDYTNYFLIFSAPSLRILYSLTTQDWNFTLAIFKTFPFIFILATAMYKLNQWGGGDVKLLFGLSLALATYPSFLLNYLSPNLVFLPFPLILFLNILIVGALYSLVYALVLVAKNRKRFLHAFIPFLKSTKKIQTLLFSLALILILISTQIQNTFIPVFIAALILILFYVYIFISSVEDSCLVISFSVSKLLEGDWIIEDVIHKEKVIHKANQELTREDIGKLKKAKIKTVIVRQGVVFVPAIFLALMVSLVFGNLILYFI
jgi:hypothetical protein